MDDHCSTVTKREGGGQDIFLICLMVNNSTFIAYYSCSVGQICLAIQHFHDITEATEVVKVCISPWRDMDAICCPVLLWSLVDAKLDASLKAERSPKYAPLHCPQTGLFWVLLQFLRGGNLGDTASGFGYKELPLPSLQPDGSSLQWGPLPVMGSTVPSWTSLGSGREQQAELCVGVRLSMVCQEG